VCSTLGAGEPVVVLGHSMGARIAMRMAADYPGEIRACILEDMVGQCRLTLQYQTHVESAWNKSLQTDIGWTDLNICFQF